MQLKPGLPDYTGPVKGPFSLLHHEGPVVEYSDNVMERIDYINREKPAHERATRLHNIMYLGDYPGIEKWGAERTAVDAKWRTERATVNAKWQAERAAVETKWWVEFTAVDAKWQVKHDAVDANCQPELAAVDAKWYAEFDAVDAPILAYIRQHIPDCAWNGRELVFPKEPS